MPHARTIQLLSANPMALPYDKLAPVLEKINEYLPEIEHIYTASRVTDLRNKTVEQLRALKDLGMDEISIGGDNLTGANFLERKSSIVASLKTEIAHGDLDTMARMRAMKATL